MKVPQLWQKWDTIRAHTGGFDKISPQGIVLTGSLDAQLETISFFSAGLSWGSSAGELCAYSTKNRKGDIANPNLNKSDDYIRQFTIILPKKGH